MDVTAIPLGIATADAAQLEAEARTFTFHRPFLLPLFLFVVRASIADRWLLYRSLWQLDVIRHLVLSAS